MSNKLYLFSQLPVDCIFAFETPDNPRKFKKLNETQAVAAGSVVPQIVNASTLVFPVYPFCLLPQVDEEQEAKLVAVLPLYSIEDYWQALEDEADREPEVRGTDFPGV